MLLLHGVRRRWRRLRRLGRHAFGFWLITFLLAALTFSLVSRVDARATLAQERWGRVASVVVMARPVAAGSVVSPRDVGLSTVPARLAAVAGALRSLDAVVGRVALVGLERGELVLRSRLAPDGLRGVAALVPPGMRAVAVPTSEGALSLSVGDRVDALATFELADAPGPPGGPDSAGAGEAGAGKSVAPTVVVVEGAVVVEVRDDAVTLAVPAPAAPRLAYALTHSTLTLAISTGTVPVEIAEVRR